MREKNLRDLRDTKTRIITNYIKHLFLCALCDSARKICGNPRDLRENITVPLLKIDKKKYIWLTLFFRK